MTIVKNTTSAKPAWSPGMKLRVTRKKIGGGTEQIEVEFDRHIPGEDRFWAICDGRKFRVSLSKVDDRFKKDAPKFEKGVTETAAAAIDKITSDKPVKTEAKPKSKAAPAKPKMDATSKVKKPSKTERVIALLAQGEDPKEIHKMVGCNSSMARFWVNIFEMVDEGKEQAFIENKTDLKYKTIEKYHALYNSLKNVK